MITIECDKASLDEFLAYCKEMNALPKRKSNAQIYEHLDNCPKCADILSVMI